MSTVLKQLEHVCPERNEWQRSSGCKTFSRPKWIEPAETRALFFYILRRNSSDFYGGDSIMTYKQIEASRELRLWIGQVIVPAVTMAVALASIPEVRNTASRKLGELKWKIKSRSKG